MSEREMWKLVHLLYLYGKPAISRADLERAGLVCHNDTFVPLFRDGVVRDDGATYALSDQARALLQLTLLANRPRGSVDMRVDHPSAFVAMPFSKRWSKPVFEQLIEPALSDAGVECLRGDTIVRVGDLASNIWREILRCGVVIADISAPNVNVFYELGLTYALGRDALLLKERSARLPADFGGAHYIEYDLADLPAGKTLLQRAVEEWAESRCADGVRALGR
jgi:hypothetical protein